MAPDYFKGQEYDFIQIFTAWGKEAVLVFFLLSGIVINKSTTETCSIWTYFRKRLVRILPIYYLSLALTVGVNAIISNQGISANVLIGNILMVGTEGGSLTSTIPFNTPVWSLSCEIFFYMVFGLLLTGKRLLNIWIWVCVAVSFVIIHIMQLPISKNWFYYLDYMFNLSLIWLIGYLLYQYRDKLTASMPTALMGVFMVPLVTRMQGIDPTLSLLKYISCAVYLIPAFALLINFGVSKSENNKKSIKHLYLVLLYLVNVFFFVTFSKSLFANKILYILLPLCSFAFYFNISNTILIHLYSSTKKGILALANISFPVYLVHMPIMYLVSFYLPHNALVGCLIMLTLVITLSMFFESVIQNKLLKYFFS
jgi:peptidoglycan/LPS O-acetylase OafA/YrhL